MTVFQIRKEFTHLRDVVFDLPHCTDCVITVMQDNRNVVTRIETPQGEFVLKDFRGMYFTNRLAYSFFRKSKAIRSFENSARLNSMGIQTPQPVAWIDEYSFGFLKRSIFVSTFFQYKTLQQFMFERQDQGDVYKKELLNALASFALKLHRRGILHDDFSIGNIFVIPVEGGYDFALTDLNRMRFNKSISYNNAMSNFRKIQLEPEDLETFIAGYARLSAKSPRESLAVFKRMKDRSSKLRRTRRKLRRYTLGLLQGHAAT